MPRQISYEPVNDSYNAAKCPETAEFMAEILAVCEKHNMFISPTGSDMEVDWHRSMRVIPFNEDCKRFLSETHVIVEE